MSLGSAWDPLETQIGTPTTQCSYRLKRDLKSLCTNPPHGVIILPDESDFLTVHALITGSEGTPYQGGFFYFILRCPHDYPLNPPKVRLMTTGGGRVRFNPNLYSNGKVCLSILGTFPGPEWSGAQSIESVLLSIQSLMNEKPYHNEPGFALEEREPGDAEWYNAVIQHETIRVAVVGMILNETGLSIPSQFKTFMQEKFMEYYQYYEKVVMEKVHFTGQLMQDPLFKMDLGTYRYEYLLEKLRTVCATMADEVKVGA